MQQHNPNNNPQKAREESVLLRQTFGGDDSFSRLMSQVMGQVKAEAEAWEEYSQRGAPVECGRLMAQGTSKRFKALLNAHNMGECMFLEMMGDRAVDQKWLYHSGVYSLVSDQALINFDALAHIGPGSPEIALRRFKQRARRINWYSMTEEADGELWRWFTGINTLNEMPKLLERAGLLPRVARKITGQLGLDSSVAF